jgi:hypothetical protein
METVFIVRFFYEKQQELRASNGQKIKYLTINLKNYFNTKTLQ